jgi:hypothetical protein
MTLFCMEGHMHIQCGLHVSVYVQIHMSLCICMCIAAMGHGF